jgi:hypothetical protein
VSRVKKMKYVSDHSQNVVVVFVVVIKAKGALELFNILTYMYLIRVCFIHTILSLYVIDVNLILIIYQ